MSRFVLQFLCEAITACTRPEGVRMVLPTANSVAVNKLQSQTSSVAVPQLEITELSDLVFLLAHLWGLDADAIREHWASHLFAAGLGDQGKDVRLSQVLLLPLMCVCHCSESPKHVGIWGIYVIL